MTNFISAPLLQVLCIRQKNEPIDLFMVEIMHMRHKLDTDTRLVSFGFNLNTSHEVIEGLGWEASNATGCARFKPLVCACGFEMACTMWHIVCAQSQLTLSWTYDH